jgi:hypothetical protein
MGAMRFSSIFLFSDANYELNFVFGDTMPPTSRVPPAPPAFQPKLKLKPRGIQEYQRPRAS